jgi:hypothetical protein
MKILEWLSAPEKKGEQNSELGRNDLCWCGSGKKYKRCHMERDDHKKRMKRDAGIKRF